MSDIAGRIKDEISLFEIASQAGVDWDIRKSVPAKGDHWAPCPFHAEKSASFHVVERGGTGGWFYCFGCGAKGSVIDFAMAHHGLSMPDAIRRLAEDGNLGDLEPAEARRRAEEREKKRADAEARAARQAEKALDGARWVWRKAWPADAEGTDILWAYLSARGVRLDAIGGVPPTLRLAHSLNYWAEGQDRKTERPAHSGPCMVASIGRRPDFRGVHRTWIAAEGRARLADGSKVPKKWLGKTGAMFGQPIRFTPTAERVVAGEGIETTLAAYSALVAAGRQDLAAEAGMSRGAITGPASDLADLWTPAPGTRSVILLGEGSAKAPDQARALYEGAKARLEALGLDVLLRVPGGRWDIDRDYADVAIEEVGR